MIFDDSKAIEIIKECLENQNINDNPRMVLRDLSKNVCLILKDGLDYTFVHRSIQEFYYASFIYNQPEMKIEFYKDCNYEFTIDKYNILNFLESMDTYYFYKYFAIPLFDVYIDNFAIDREPNQLIKHLFYKIINTSDIEVEFKVDISKEHPFYYFDILHGNLASILVSSKLNEGQIRMFRSVHTVNLEISQTIQKIYTQEGYYDLKTKLHNHEQKVLKRREEMISFIDKKDSKKYRKYLNR